ncbi:MAG: TonB-dependent receptor [Acidobacteria bacterium]|nr:TonB-dependent receptor [Acidobacteriota bacterium]
MNRTFLSTFGLLACLLVCSSTTMFAQADTAQISGFVKDATGAVVPGASVTLTNEATQLTRQVETNESGYYVVSALPPGYYTVAVEAEGFKRSVTSQNKLDASIAANVDVTLEVGAVSESIEVTASATQLQSETATVGRLVDQTQIENIVLNGRNPLFLALLKPGVRGGSLAGFSFGLTSGGFSINGSRSQDNVIQQDGAINMRTRANGTSIGVADTETVQEMQVLTADYAAEYGRTNGGMIRMVTKSGTSQFHGAAYEYFRNDKLDANTWQRNRSGLDRTANKFNQFGYVLSGPVFVPNKWNTDKNKLFWLWSQEWVRYREESTSIITVPSLAMRTGDFSELLNASNPFFGRVRTVNDPSTGSAFANNIIPQSRLSPNGVAMLNASPEPSPGFLQGRNNFIQTRPSPQDQRKDTVSVDYNPNEKHNFRFRLQNYNFFQPEAFRSGTDRAVRTIDRPNRTYTLNYIWTVSPTWINEALASVSYDRVYLEVPITDRLKRSTYGIDYSYIFPERKEIFDKIPTIDISNFQQIDGGPYPSSSSGPIYQLSNNVTHIFGNHTLKFGGRYERAGQNDFDQINVSGVPGGTNNQNGRFIYTDSRANGSGMAVSNAALGLFTSYAEIGPRAYTPYRGQMWEAFVQDSWKATQKLRVELGLRYTWMYPYYYSVWRNMAVFDPSKYDPSKAVVQDPDNGNVLSGDRFNGVVIPGTGWPDAALGRVAIADSGEYDNLFSGGSKYYGQIQKANFQPRVGLAYRLDDKTVIRSGIGRFFARPGVADNIFLGGNPPFQPTVSISDGLADNPGSGTNVGFPQYFMTQDPVFKIPSAWNWNFTVERQVGRDTIVEVGYVGRVGLHMERVRDLNQLPIGTVQANAGIDRNYLRPYKGFANIPMNENAARSEYKALQFSVNRRFTKGLSYGLAYTYGSSWDNADSRRDQIYNSYNDKNFWGWSDFDTRHVLIMNTVWEAPFFRNSTNGLLRNTLGGWTLSGVVQFQSGTPLTVQTSDDFAGIGSGDAGQPWEVSADPYLGKGDRGFSEGVANDDVYFFRTTDSSGNPLFTAPAQGTFSSTQHRNQYLHGPGFQNWNLGVFKNFSITERQKVSFRAELFNLPNHPNLGGVDSNPRNSTFGRVTSKNNDRRNIQLSLRYSF